MDKVESHLEVLELKITKEVLNASEVNSIKGEKYEHLNNYLITIKSVEDYNEGIYSVFFFNQSNFNIFTKIEVEEGFYFGDIREFSEETKHILPEFILSRYELIKSLNKHATPIKCWCGYGGDVFAGNTIAIQITFIQ